MHPSDKKLNILYITPKKELIGGGAAQAVQLVKELSNKGHKAILVTQISSSCEQTAKEKGIRLRMFPLRHRFDVQSMLLLYRLMKQEKIDIVHVHNDSTHALAYFPAIWANVPAFVINRGVSLPVNYLNRFGFYWKKVGAIITVAEELRQMVLKNVKIPPQKVVTIHGGTDLERFDWKISGETVRKEFDIPLDYTVIGIIANLLPWKGHRYFFAAAKPLLIKYSKTAILLVGDDSSEYAKQLRKEVAPLGNKVVFTGYRTDIPQIMAALDMNVICSYDWEGLSGSLREALAMKKAVISTRVGGNAEVVEHGVNGFLVPPKDVEALRNAIERLIVNPDLRRKMGEEGRKLIESKFSLAERINKIEALYYQLVHQYATQKQY